MSGAAPATDGLPGRRDVRPLGGILTAMAVSTTGTRISGIALPWFVLVTTGSATLTGLVAFFEMTPYVVVKALTGPLVDRAGPRVVSWTTDLVSASAAAAVPLLHALHLLPFPVLLALVALIGAARGPGDLAKEVMVPEAADRSRVPLERATGLSGVIERLAGTVGPAAGGTLIALVGPLTGLAVNAACFAAGSVIVSLVLPRDMGQAATTTPPAGTEPPGAEPPNGKLTRGGPPNGEPPRENQEPGYWQRFGEGFAFLRGDPLLLALVVMIGITNLLDAGFSAVLVPVWARETGHGPTGIGLVAGTAGAAAIGGSLLAAVVAHRLRRRAVFFVGFLLAGAPKFLILAADAPLGAVLTVFAVSGLGAGFLNPIIGAVLFERVPRPLLGRVGALGDSLAWSGIPLGGLIAGAAVAAVGSAPVLLAGGAAYFLTTTLTGLRPEWREMDRGRGPGAGRQQVEDLPAPRSRSVERPDEPRP